MPLSLDFAFEGFRIIREKPKLVPFWGVILLIGNGLANLLIIAIGGPALDKMASVSATTDPAVLMAIYSKVMAAYGAALPVLIVTQAVLACAVFRAVWGEKDDRFGYLRFGAAELRQIGATVLFFLSCMLFGCAVLICAFLLSALGGDKAVAMTIFTAGAIAGGAAIAAAAVRLSLYAAQSFDQKKINIFGSWTLTKGRGWTLFGGYLVTAIMVLFVVMLCNGIMGAVALAVNGGDWASLNVVLRPDQTSLQAYFRPLNVTWLVLSELLVAPLAVALQTGAQAAAYRTLAGQVPDGGI